MLKDLSIKNTYDSEYDDVVDEFYTPVLGVSVDYKRISGFFSSSSLLASLKGISDFIKNGGKYQLITGVIISKEDTEAIERGVLAEKDIIERLKLDVDVGNIEGEIEKDHFKVFSWLIATGRMEIKLALVAPNNSGIFHTKIGLLTDSQDNTISFSGSVNETYGGWYKNIEEFKVFRGWIEEEKKYAEKDIDMFKKYWRGDTKRFSTYDLPRALVEDIIRIKPQDEDIPRILEKIKKKPFIDKKNEKVLRDYQETAIKNWLDNDCKGIFEMATGTGKTFTALSVLKKLIEIKKNLFTVVIVPYTNLGTQWETEITDFLKLDRLLFTSNSNNWKQGLTTILNDYNDGIIKTALIITTYDTASSKFFTNAVESTLNKFRENALLIADEMHHAGAKENSKCLLNSYGCRLGLSATPRRWFDDKGTQITFDYFGATVFEFTLNEAIEKGYLVKYNYYPHFVELTGDEMREYIRLTRSLTYNRHDERVDDELVERILNLRSKVLKSAENKILEFEQILKKIISENKADHLLVYCDSHSQIEDMQRVLNRYSVTNHRFTDNENTKDRAKLLKLFDEGLYKCLVAVTCLDEGVDVPSTKTAVIVASTTNPREFIQRRGRVLRKYRDAQLNEKKLAEIYDLTVVPMQNFNFDSLGKAVERRILKKEFDRIKEFLESAENKTQIITKLTPVMLRYDVYL